MSLTGYDIDGALYNKDKKGAPEIPPPGSVVISGRVWTEYDETVKTLAQHVPVYIRGHGLYNNDAEAAAFKITMITLLGVDTFYESSAFQVEIIKAGCPSTRVIRKQVGNP